MHERGEGRAERLVEQLRSGGLRCLSAFAFAGVAIAGVAIASVAIAGCDGPSSAGAAQSESAKPQQLVQRIEPAPAVQSGNARANSEGNNSEGKDSEAKPAVAASAGEKPSTAPGDSARPGAAQTVTAKHVEAELNRLEAELNK